MHKPVVLLIMDGYGIRKSCMGNEIAEAKKPHIDFLLNEYPNILLDASEEYVGLPTGQMGNSEVGHMNIGAGRIVYQSLTLINKAIKDKEFYKNDKFLAAIKNVKDNNSTLHIMGLLSNGGVHSSLEHIFALLELAKKEDLKDVMIHCIMDGRDTDPHSGLTFLNALRDKINEVGIGHIASIAGRYYAMDRDKNLLRTDKFYSCIVNHIGNSFQDYHSYVESDYEDQGENSSDEFIKPAYFNGSVKLKSKDSVIFANYRPDRAIQIGTVITNPTFYKELGYEPETKLSDIHFVSMMKYADSVLGSVAYKLPDLNNVLGVYLANNNYTQLRIAETEKYAHVTFFMDGMVKYDGVEAEELKGCKRILIPSPKVATYDLQPEMSAYKVTDSLIEELDKKYLDVVIINLANCDMVGHTAIIPAVKKAVEVVDECVGKIFDKVNELGGVLMLTADHGNAECIIDESGHPFTAHTTNPVPLVITDKKIKFTTSRGKLSDLAPTLLTLLGAKVPVEMTGKVLITEEK